MSKPPGQPALDPLRLIEAAVKIADAERAAVVDQPIKRLVEHDQTVADYFRRVGQLLDQIDRGLTSPTTTSQPDVPAMADLTPRQREVLDRLLAGDSQKQIAAALGISRHTVGDHLKDLHRIFDVSSRGELLAKFIAR